MNQNNALPSQLETATLAGGCFWCLEAVFDLLRGIESITSGYSGGTTENPTYKEVTTGNTGHAEAVQIIFNPSEISYKKILEVFFTIHDPTTLNRQGADAGTQYRSSIFCHSDEQQKTAVDVIREINESKIWENPIVTEVNPFQNFYPAEDEHKDYYKLHGNEPYCSLVIAPKVVKIRKHFIDMLKK